LSDHYEVLGISRDASQEEIKKAYRKLARELHPDMNPGEEHQERFKMVTYAYEVLSDESSRQQYDMGGSSPFGDQSGFGFGDIFENFFGGGQRGPRKMAERGQDALLRVELTLGEVVFGVEKQVEIDTAVLCETCHGTTCRPGTSAQLCDICKGSGQIQRQVRSILGNVVTSAPCGSCRGYGQTIPDPCLDCRGQGRTRARRSLDLNIPGGVEHGLRLQLSGQGEVGFAGGPSGDIFVEINVRADQYFERDGDDLLANLESPLHDAVLGTIVPIETFDGKVDVEIKAGAQTGDVVTLKAKGIKHLRHNGRGDMNVRIQVLTPSKLDSKEKEHFKKLAELRKSDKAGLAKLNQSNFGRRSRR
jgi:molecular chaperone DnaJ